MFQRIATFLWGNFESTEELKKFVFLALIFGLIIGTYWALRPIKDGIFDAIIGGKDWLWLAKIASLIVISPLVILYVKLIDKYPRHKVFYALMAFYSIVSFVFMIAFMNPTIGLANTIASPTRIIGWAWYVFVESFGSLIVALFWAFTTDTTRPDAARRGFPVIALFGQLGNILGPFLLQARRWGFVHSGPIVGICGALMVLIGFAFWIFMQVTPKEQLEGYKEEVTVKEKGEKPGFAEGLRLLFTEGYLLGIFLVLFIYEFVVTLIDYHFKQTVFATFSTEAERSAFLSDYASWVGIVATLCVLFGINSIQRRLGMTASLLLLPILVSVAVVTVYFNPTGLNVAMWIMVFAKAVNYALNQPTMKQLYIPTTKDTKYKAQAWIEMFGSRGSKGAGFGLSGLREPLGLMFFLTISTVFSLGLIGLWVMIAVYVAKTYNKAIAEDKVVC